MKKQLITIDINMLNDVEIDTLKTIFADHRQYSSVQQLMEREAFLKGWMCEEDEQQYFKKYCAD